MILDPAEKSFDVRRTCAIVVALGSLPRLSESPAENRAQGVKVTRSAPDAQGLGRGRNAAARVRHVDDDISSFEAEIPEHFLDHLSDALSVVAARHVLTRQAHVDEMKLPLLVPKDEADLDRDEPLASS